MLVGQLSGAFFVPGYQRGYRWGQHEVEALLDDVLMSDGEYYLQPIVVKQLDGGRWELIDGQQRLTTLYLILRYIQGHLPMAQVDYSIEYETRPMSADYLDALDPERSQDNIDFFHLFQAAEVIRDWFEGADDPTLRAVNVYQALASRVHLIWYEAPADLDERTLFARLNIGRIPLTDGELVKAVLLSRVQRPEEVAAQWDIIERDLRHPELWSFLTGRPDPIATHISLLLDTLAGGPIGPTRPLFHTFETLRNRIEAGSPETTWEAVLDLHSLISAWFDDHDLVHKIGFLVSAGLRVSSLVEPAQTMTGTELNDYLDDEIRSRLDLTADDLTDLSYRADKAQISRLLLLVNTETLRRRPDAAGRYSFASHASRNWSLEHIDAQSAEPLVTAAQWTEWLHRHGDALEALPEVDPDERSALITDIQDALGDGAGELTGAAFRSLEERVLSMFASAVADSEDATHAVTNLALLAFGDNAVLSNAKFEVKRREILRLDRQGSFIPPATRNVFLKYYTGADAQQVHFWSPQDRDAYMEEILELVQPYLTEEPAGA
ncbi:MAG: DUF262 domain-containing protein [Hyphomicrobiales bacterium]|nr:DUF262 domain-containing protein [Hyphomicrobiales bacterium]